MNLAGFASSHSVVIVRGEIDIHSLRDLEEQMRSAQASGLAVVVDLRECRYFGACGFGCLVRWRSLLAGRLSVIVATGSFIARLFTITELRDFLNVRDSLRPS